MKKVQLARHTDVPTNEWKYAYQLPSDRIGGPFAVFDSVANGAQPAKEFEIFADKIFSNYETMYCDYPFKPSESAFPAYFTEFVVLAIASVVAIPVTDQTTTAKFYDQLAYGLPSENRAGGQLARARYSDSSQQPPQILEDYTLIDVRN